MKKFTTFAKNFATTFAASRIISIAVSAILIATFTIPQALATSTTTASYDDAIYYLESYDLLPNADTFNSDDILTRAELYEFILTYAQVDLVNQNEVNLPFTDTPNTASYARALQTALNIGLIKYTPKIPKFSPNRSVRKREIVTKLFDTLGVGVNKLFDKSSFPFTDLSTENTFAPYAQKAYEIGITEPSNPTLARVVKVITKGEAANMLYIIDQYFDGTGTIVIHLDTGSSTGSTNNTNSTINNPVFDILLDVWETIKNNYYYQDEIDEEKMLYSAINGIVDTLSDPYTIFTTPDETNGLEILDSEYEGVGMSVEMVDDEVTVITPFKDSPAESAGVEPNDIITKVDGTSVDGMSLEAVVSLIKGTAGTSVVLTIKRGSKTLEITVTRGYIFYKTAELEFIEESKGDIAYINMLTFGDNTYYEFLEAAQQIHDHEDGVLGVIIDLRNNPGGYLNTAIDIGGFFYDENKIQVILKDNEGKRTTYQSTYYGATEEYNWGAGLLSEEDIVVLVNDGSASASEILAGSLQDHDRATIIGEQSFGKGTVQELSFYTDDSMFKLTVSKWLTPDGHDINKKGVTPDKVVINSAGNDEQLDEAIEVLVD